MSMAWHEFQLLELSVHWRCLHCPETPWTGVNPRILFATHSATTFKHFSSLRCRRWTTSWFVQGVLSLQAIHFTTQIAAAIDWPNQNLTNTAIDSAAPPLLNASISSASLAYIQLYNPLLCSRKTNERPQHRRITIQIQCITFAMLNVGMSHGETLARSMTTAICNRANMSRAKNYALADVQ